MRHSPQAFPNVSARWLLTAVAITLLGIVVCAWLSLCLLYWQGSWQLLYRPNATISRTPASVGLPFELEKFAATETGINRLTGWWLPAENARFTVLYLHGADGNLSDTLDMLAALHRENLNVFAIDYRGYGQSQAARPTEKQLRQDAEWALTWLTLTRQIPAKTIIAAGTGLGANLAAELASDHPELAGVLLDRPSSHHMDPILNDPRSRLVPARWLVHDQYDLFAATTKLETPSLWLLPKIAAGKATSGSSADLYGSVQSPGTPSNDAYHQTPGRKDVAWLTPPSLSDPHMDGILRRWLDDL